MSSTVLLTHTSNDPSSTSMSPSVNRENLLFCFLAILSAARSRSHCDSGLAGGAIGATQPADPLSHDADARKVEYTD